jgi:Family of unknown function (DUF6325)
VVNDTDIPGPIDYVLIEFPPDGPTSSTAEEVLSLVDRGIMRLYDMIMVRKSADGAVDTVEASDLAPEAAFAFSEHEGARSGLLSTDDVAEVAGALEPGTIGLLLLFENSWAVPFVRAAYEAGGAMIASERHPAQAIIDALEALEAAD